VLDVMMPLVDGLDVCRRLRARGDRTPVLMLTARDQVRDRVAGLDAGADDYLPKPFALDELLARLRALLRRTDVTDDATLRFEDLELDIAGRIVRRGDRVVLLTRTEFQILEMLMRNAGTVLDRMSMYTEIWGYDGETSSKALDVHTRYVRRKLEEGGEPRLIHTVHGVGYVLRSALDGGS
jgi:two-component system response regulator MprA